LHNTKRQSTKYVELLVVEAVQQLLAARALANDVSTMTTDTSKTSKVIIAAHRRRAIIVPSTALMLLQIYILHHSFTTNGRLFSSLSSS
jgi:hypothetical protein